MAIGLVYLIAFSLGGQPGNGLIGLRIMVAFSAAIALLGWRSETVRGILDHRDERLAGIDLRATAVTAIVMLLAVLAGSPTRRALSRVRPSSHTADGAERASHRCRTSTSALNAAVAGYRLLARDASRFRAYFPSVGLIAPA